MKRSLILTLNRIGDICQASPLFSALKREGFNVSVVCLDVFAQITAHIQAIDKVYRFIPKANLEEFVTTINKQGSYDLLINLSQGITSSIFQSNIRAKAKTGLDLARDNGFVSQSPYTAYYLSVPGMKWANRINITELFMLVSGHQAAIDEPTLVTFPEDDRKMSSLFPPNRLLIAIHPGASSPDRSWLPQNFAEVAQALIDEFNAVICIVGTETAIADDIEHRLDGNCINLGGKTTLSELLSVLKRSDLVIGSDSMPLHAAARLGTPTVGIYLGQADYNSTGPYGSNHHVIQERLDHPVDVEEVLWTIKQAIGIEQEPPEGKKWEVARSMFGPDNFLTYQLLIKQPLSPKLLLALVMRYTAPTYLAERLAIGPDLLLKAVQSNYYVEGDILLQVDGELGPFLLLSESFKRGYSICCDLLDELENGKNPIQVRLYKEALDKEDKSIARMAERYELLAVMVELFVIMKTGLYSQDIRLLSGEYKAIYKLHALWSQHIYDLSITIAEKVMEEVKK